MTAKTKETVRRVVQIILLNWGFYDWRVTGSKISLILSIVLMAFLLMEVTCDFVIEWAQGKIRQIEEQMAREEEEDDEMYD